MGLPLAHTLPYTPSPVSTPITIYLHDLKYVGVRRDDSWKVSNVWLTQLEPQHGESLEQMKLRFPKDLILEATDGPERTWIVKILDCERRVESHVEIDLQVLGRRFRDRTGQLV